MKDYEKLEADVVKLLTKHYSKGRGGHKVDKVIEHYNAGDLSIGGCWSVWQTREASAHYQVESDGDSGQLVWDGNTSWNCGVWEQNQRSIGIEHANKADGTITEECLDEGAHITAAICRKYGLGRPEWLKNVFPHKYFKSTSCPGQIYGRQKDDYIERAQYWYDRMGGKDVQKPAATKPSTESQGSSKGLGDYRYWGPKVTREMQRQCGTEVDGVVSRQPTSNRRYAQNCDTTSWIFTSKLKTSSGYQGSALVKKLQRRLKDRGWYKGEVDGFAGKKTFKALQGFLIKRGYSCGSYGANGVWGPASNTALCKALEDGIIKKWLS